MLGEARSTTQLFLVLQACLFTPGSTLARVVAPRPALVPTMGCPPMARAAVHAVMMEPEEDTIADSCVLGQVVAAGAIQGLVVVRPEARELARVGTMLSFSGGGYGVIIAERCGLYFAKALNDMPQCDERATLLPRDLTIPAWDTDAPTVWGGVYNHLGEPMLDETTRPPDASSPTVDVFAEPVPAARRRPIGASLHTGVVAIDALTPIGRGQSMMLFGPDALPSGCGRTDLALRLLSAQHTLQTGVKSLLVLTGSGEERERALGNLRASGALEHTKVLVAETVLEGILAASAACSIAETCENDDVLVVIDSLRSHLQLWKVMVEQLQQQSVPVTPEEEASQQRAYYARLVERAARRKAGGSVTLVLLQPSVSVLPSQSEAKESYSLADFEAAGFTNTVCTRVRLLEEKGIVLNQEILIKVGIPLPGSEHPAAGKGQRSAQHLEELTSLVDGHVDLRENLAAQGRVPPIDPANSLTRIGVGSSKLRPLSQTAAMAAVCGPLRLELASASDYVHCEEAEARRAAAYMAVLQQPDPQPLPLGSQVALLRAASSGALDTPITLSSEELTPELLNGLLAHIATADPDIMPRISETGLLGDTTSQRLGELTDEYLDSWIALHDGTKSSADVHAS